MGSALSRLCTKENREEGLIFNIQRFSLHDGPGIRTTVFLKGCPLSCKWCSNPESINIDREIMTFDMMCIRCGKCVEVCQTKAITIVENIKKIDRTKCNLCLECAKVCPSGAIQEVGKYMSIEQVVKEIKKDKPFYINSNGGVTFSGGEPLLQWRLVREVCRKCKEENISTALETSGYVTWEHLEKTLDYVDLVLYDIKHLDSSMHIDCTGASNELILENLVKTVKKARTWLRIPVIPNYNDSQSYMVRLGEFSAGLGVEKVSLLPYHEWGVQKYERLGRVYTFNARKPPTEEFLLSAKEILESFGLKVTVGR